MAKLELFDGKQTKWQGLWYHPDGHCYTSAAMNLAGLKAFKGTFRVMVIKNKFHKDGDNRPNYVFRIQDSKSDNPFDLEVEDAETEEEEERTFTEREVKDLLRKAIDETFYACEGGLSDPYDVIPEDFIGGAR